jgi:hypothetical protein
MATLTNAWSFDSGESAAFTASNSDSQIDTRLTRMAEFVHNIPAGGKLSSKELSQKIKETMK